jgi:hypothetical protein
MPIVGHSLEEAANNFVDYLNGVLFKTITQVPLQVLPVRERDCVSLGFRQAAGPQLAELRSKYGKLFLSLSQNCTSHKRSDGFHELRTSKYWYYIYNEDGRPIIRWEYARDWDQKGTAKKPKFYCRGHVQGAIPITMNKASLLLDDVHAPTGYVTVEDIARFCIEDLEVKFKDRPADWHTLLVNSYVKFCQDFTRGEDWDGDR